MVLSVRVGEFSTVLAFLEYWAHIKFKLSVFSFLQGKYHLLLINSEVTKNLQSESKQGLKHNIWRTLVGVVFVKLVDMFEKGGGKDQLF